MPHEADDAVLGGLASGAGRRAVAEAADDVRSQITAHSVDGARTPSQQALDERSHMSISQLKRVARERRVDVSGCLDKADFIGALDHPPEPRTRSRALSLRTPNGPNGTIVRADASPARAAGEDDGEPRFAPGERRGSYAYGTLYFEETRLRSRYMLCRGEPGACPPEEVMANLCDEFGLPNPQMIFFGLGANGRWNTGFATLDVFASKLINQVRSSGPFRSEARLGSVEDERAATALNDWGTLGDLDLTIIDNALIEHFFDDDDDPHAPDVDANLAARLQGKRDEVFQFGFALRRYAAAAKNVLHEIGQFDFNDAASSKSGKADPWDGKDADAGRRPVEKDCRVLVWDGAKRRLGTVREVHETTLAAAPAATAAPAGAPASEAAVAALRKTVTVVLDDKLDAGGAERKYDAARVHHVRGSMRLLLTQCLKDLAKRIYDTTLRRGQCLTKEGLRAYEEYLHEAKCGGRRAPTTGRELQRRYLDEALKTIKDARNHKKRQKRRDAARATAARGLLRYTSALEGDPVALAQGLAHEFFLAESAVFKPGSAKGDHAPPQAEIERLVVEAAHIVVYADNEGHEGKKLLSSLEAMRNACRPRVAVAAAVVAHAPRGGARTGPHTQVERPRGRARGRRRGQHGGPPGRGRRGLRGRQAARGPVLLSAAAGARQGPVSHPQEEVRARLQRVHGERCPGVLRVAGLARVRAFVAVLVQPVARHVRERRPALRAVLLDVRFDLPRALHDVLRPGQSGEPRGPAGAEGPEGLGGARARGGHDGALRRRRRPIHALHAQG